MTRTSSPRRKASIARCSTSSVSWTRSTARSSFATWTSPSASGPRSGSVPNLVGTDPLLGPEAEGDVHVAKLERAVDLVQETEEVEHLAIDAFRRGEDVRVILRKGSDARQPLRDSRFLIPVEPREVGVPHGQVPVAPRLGPEQEAVARAVHRLDAELALVDLDEEHVLAVSAGVARCPEELLVENLGRDDLLVAVLDV